ncbi:MAG TPA: flippase [Xanthobacteraceae bacterium]|nr:flippase [Xanthobacteraceae bacterium]
MKAKALTTNFAINVIGAVVPLIVALATVPLYVRHIGEARYGVLALVIILLGYFGFLDLGLSRAAANILAKMRDAPHADRARVLTTAFLLNLGFGTLGGLVIYFGGMFLLDRVVSVPQALKPEIASSFPWIAVLFPMALLHGVAIGVLESRERFLAANLLQVAGGSIGQIIPVMVAVLVSPSLAIVIPAAAVSRGLAVLAVLAFVYREEQPLNLTAFDRTEARKLLGYGGWVSVSSIVMPLLTTLDQMLVGALLGVAAVAHYVVPMNLVVRSQVFAAALARTLFPRLSHFGAVDARELTVRSITTLAFGYGAICAPALLVASPFLKLWIGEEFAAISAPVAQILFPGAWINGISFVLFTLLQGQGRPDLVAKIHAVQLVPFVGAIWYATQHYGLTGVAVVWTVRCVVDAVMLVVVARLPYRRFAWFPLAAIGFIIPFAIARWSMLTDWELFGTAVLVGLAWVAMAFVFSQDLRAGFAIVLARLSAGAQPDAPTAGKTE